MRLASCVLIIQTMLGASIGADAQAGQVVLYSSNDVQTVSSVVEQFERQNPDVKVAVVRAGTGALMQRIKAEAANPLGDIFWSGGLSTIGAFQEVFEAYRSPQADAVAARYRGPDGLWLGTNTHVSVLMVNVRQVPNGTPPSTWADLADPRWKGKIAIPDPQFSSASYVALYGIRSLLGESIYARIVRNAVVVGTTSAAYQGVANGEFAAAVTMEYAAYQYVAGGLKEIKVVYPAEGTFLSPEGMALIKNAKHPAEARRLYDFLASKPTQALIFERAFRRPLRPDIDVAALSALPPLAGIKTIDLDDSRMEADRAQFLAQWRQLVSSN
ncbi:ABC transporter substrate-binding protein [Bordetella bronchialis]|uniref:ABC transporter substrate-binding protein n=2 Tax=Bordetella bronchialis TaxID=463025 RepID=A0A193G3B1_9BORD|nr:ABC transporter substrate-binding protein [Bordetella bronchialis]ANN74482.1 ABC transporter substrate-binding protein [Bordetella bronchialis]